LSPMALNCDPTVSTSCVAGITDMRHYTWPFSFPSFFFFFWKSHYIPVQLESAGKSVNLLCIKLSSLCTVALKLL
jgi:hypothetical protein